LKKFISYFVFCFIIFVCACSVLFNLNKPEKKETKKLTKVKVSEVAHTIFYAPQYVAIEKGFFKEEGLDIELILSNGADKVSAAVLSGDADIGFSGSEATIYVYNGGEKDYLKTFAQLTQKDGTFIVSREKIDNFKLDDLIDKKIIGGRAGGMPEMTLEYIIKSNNIDISKIEELPYADLWTCSFPCTDISVCGKMKGLNPDSGTRSSLLWENIRLLKKAKDSNSLPKYIMFENVKNLVNFTLIL